jgi:hypothetical protein
MYHKWAYNARDKVALSSWEKRKISYILSGAPKDFVLNFESNMPG